jgi:hypothetical protein
MVNIINSISNSLLSAYSRIGAAETCINVFEAAKARKDQSTMDRALSYASPNISDAMEYASNITDEVRRALREAREEEKRLREQDASEKTDEDKNTASQERGPAIDSGEQTGNGEPVGENGVVTVPINKGSTGEDASQVPPPSVPDTVLKRIDIVV